VMIDVGVDDNQALPLTAQIKGCIDLQMMS
jgi:hypothetical protein